jgi:tetratricopeptide (TPR) repeat protein
MNPSTKTMKYFLSLALACLAYSSFSQTATELYNKKDYDALVRLESEASSLSAKELYMVGYAFFRKEDDQKAIAFYDKAIQKGLNDGAIHFYKGLSLRYLKKYNDALVEIDKSLQLEPQNQEFMNEKGMVYYDQSDYDKALQVFEAAEKLPNTFPEPFFWVARIYQEKKAYKKALNAYYEAKKNLPVSNSHYYNTLTAIGVLEYLETKDYQKSARAYEEAIALKKENYELYYKLMKSYNAATEYKKADSVFLVVKDAFTKGKLSKDDMEIKSVAIAQFEWKGQIATIRKSLVDAEKMLDISYKVFVMNEKGEEIERRFVVEKTVQLEDDGLRYLLCEQDKKTGRHITYPYGWKEDNIPVADLEKSVKLVLNGKMQAGASSNFGE